MPDEKPPEAKVTDRLFATYVSSDRKVLDIDGFKAALVKKRLYAFWGDRELVLMEGGDTLVRLVDEMVVSVKARALVVSAG